MAGQSPIPLSSKHCKALVLLSVALIFVFWLLSGSSSDVERLNMQDVAVIQTELGTLNSTYVMLNFFELASDISLV